MGYLNSWIYALLYTQKAKKDSPDWGNIFEGFVKNKALYDEYVKAMSTDRNVKMTETAKNYLSEGKTGFVVVGLAHVIGEGGIAEALRNEGYSVERISFE